MKFAIQVQKLDLYAKKLTDLITELFQKSDFKEFKVKKEISFKELYDKYGYMIFTLSEEMGMYSTKGLGLPYSIFTSNDKKTNRIIFPVAGSFVFNGGLSELEKTINLNKSNIKKIKLSVDVAKLPKGSEHLFMPLDYGDGYIIPTKEGDPPRYLEEGEYEIIN